jgi:hypothetical protein
VLEGESVPHRDHHHPEAVGEPGGPRMPGVQVTHDEPAAMQPHDRAGRLVRAAVERAHPSGSAGTRRYAEDTDATDRERITGGGGATTGISAMHDDVGQVSTTPGTDQVEPKG